VSIWSSGGLLEIPVSLETTFSGEVHPLGHCSRNDQDFRGRIYDGLESRSIQCPPVHTIDLSAYLIDRFEVVNAQYVSFVQATNHRHSPYEQQGNPDVANRPIMGVSWRDADEYCRWIGGRLPTEAEWEKAARGIDARTYPWGETSPNSTLLNYSRQSNGPLAVGNYPAGVSPFGIHDAAGNVWEWTNDWFGGTYYSTSPDKDPQGPEQGTLRVIRGGSWAESDTFVLTFNRFWSSANTTSDLIGFRCVVGE
jgi:formylglycine-generating enzyme required for sulfatase activity